MIHSEADQLTAQLVRGPLDAFTASRAELARELRSKKQTELAKQIASLRKPSLAMWALNQADAVAADDMDAMRSAARSLRAAQERVLRGEPDAADDLRHATEQHRRSIDTLSRRLGMVLSAAGHAASDDTLRRVAEGLRAASFADDATWAAVVEGRLLTEPEAVTFPVIVEGLRPQRVGRQREAREDTVRRQRIHQAETRVQRAEALLRDALAQEADAQQRRAAAQRAVDDARAALEALRDG